MHHAPLSCNHERDWRLNRCPMHVLVLMGLRFQTIFVFKLLYAQPPVTDEQETKKQYGGTAVELQTGPACSRTMPSPMHVSRRHRAS